MPLGGFPVGVCRPLLQILTLFQTKKLSYPTPFFRPGVGRNYVAITWIRVPCEQRPFDLRRASARRVGLERQQKEFLKPTLNLYITTNTFIHSLENHTRIQTKIGNPENGAKTLSFGAGHTHKVNIREYPREHTPRMA